jgi:predicted nucleotidyltransferase
MLVQPIVPKLSLNILSNIVHDAVELCPNVIAVGLVGSYANGAENHSSDIDLIVRHDGKVKFHEILESFGGFVEHILDYQFNKRLDIIRYDHAMSYATTPPKHDKPWFCRQSFSQMIEEVKWLYER